MPTCFAAGTSTVSLQTMKLVIPRLLRPGVVRAVTTKTSPHAGVGDEDLRAVEDPVIALLDGRRRRSARVRAGARLGEAEAAQHRARREVRHPLRALLVGPELDDRRRAEVGVLADGEPVRRIDLAQLVHRHDVRQVVHPRPAQLLAPRHAQQAELGHALHRGPRELGARVVLPRDGRDLGAREVANHFARLEMVILEEQAVVHVGSKIPNRKAAE